MLKVSELSCGYKDLEIIHGISFNLEQGQIKVLLSLNGGGKTTLLKTLSGLIEAKSGKVILNNEDITYFPPRERVKRGMLYIPEWGIFPNLTVKENIIVASNSSSSSSGLDMNFIFEKFKELKDKMDNKAASLSGGQRKLLMLAMAVSSGAKLLLLDEPSSGLSPSYVDRLIDIIKGLRDNGITFLIAEQNPSFSEISDEIMVLELGRIVASGKYEDLKKNNEIKSKFFSL